MASGAEGLVACDPLAQEEEEVVDHKNRMYIIRTCKKTGEKFTFFFGKDSVFSQWHSVEFKVDGVEYNCAEQYMMHQKAGKFVEVMSLCAAQIQS